MTHDVERVFADIDADHGDRCIEFLRHGVLLVLSVPCQLVVPAGPEHGRTIPLADIGLSSILVQHELRTLCEVSAYPQNGRAADNSCNLARVGRKAGDGCWRPVISPECSMRRES